jgi:hypothetical protein
VRLSDLGDLLRLRAPTPPLFLCRRNRQQHIFRAALFSISSVLEISSGVPWGAGASVTPAVLACKCLQEVEQKNDPIGISDTLTDTRWRAEWWSAGAANDLCPTAPRRCEAGGTETHHDEPAVALRPHLPKSQLGIPEP